jgi:hypothetical protein
MSSDYVGTLPLATWTLLVPTTLWSS